MQRIVIGRTFSTAAVLFAVLVTAVSAGLLAAFAAVYLLRPADSAAPSDLSVQFPLTQLADAFSCPKGLTRIVQRRGTEDGFAPAGNEPAQIDARLLHNGYFADLADGATSAFSLRAYDEGGSDKILIDHFTLPRGIVSRKLVMRIAKAGAGANNDGARFGDLDALAHAASGEHTGARDFGVDTLWHAANLQKLADGSAIATLEFAELINKAPSQRGQIKFLDYLAQAERGPNLDLTVADDSKVDAVALLACQLPTAAKGVTFAEHRSEAPGNDVSWFSCNMDQTQHGCDPFAGDRLCSAPGPIACYRDGNRTAPPGLKEAGVSNTSFVGGEVRMSKPVRGDQFAHLGEANGFCEVQFGTGWRVLSYHEGGGGQVVSYSRIAPLTRALVNIRDQQYGNCWDRDLKR